jgi:hypothetical protein
MFMLRTKSVKLLFIYAGCYITLYCSLDMTFFQACQSTDLAEQHGVPSNGILHHQTHVLDYRTFQKIMASIVAQLMTSSLLCDKHIYSRRS